MNNFCTRGQEEYAAMRKSRYMRISHGRWPLLFLLASLRGVSMKAVDMALIIGRTGG